MKVYAEFIDDNGLLFRTKTLLQYGDSWDLIGSIVMKNPGSAKPGTPLNEDSKIGISEFYAEDINFENWTEASNDPTLKKVAAIFDGSYLEKNIELDGIIQVFNIYNICEPKIKFAYQKAENSNTDLLFINLNKTIKQFRNKPVYLGFFDFYTFKKTRHSDYLQSISKGIFDSCEYPAAADKDESGTPIITSALIGCSFAKIFPNSLRFKWTLAPSKVVSGLEK